MRGLEDVDAQTLVVAMRRVQERTGVNLADGEAQLKFTAAESRRAMRQIVGGVGGGMLGAIALICLVLAVVPGDAGAGLRIAFVVVALLFAAAAAKIVRTMMRPTTEFRTEFQPRRDAWGLLYRELGRPDPYKLKR